MQQSDAPPIKYTMRQVVAACQTLDVEPDASAEDIRKSFRRLSLEWHPDKNRHRSEEAARTFGLITRARDILTARAALQQYEADERDEASNFPPHFPGRPIPCSGRDGAIEKPRAGDASKGWGPCPACGGLKRHVGGRVCPIYGRWFETEKMLRGNGSNGNSAAATRVAAAEVAADDSPPLPEQLDVRLPTRANGNASGKSSESGSGTRGGSWSLLLRPRRSSRAA